MPKEAISPHSLVRQWQQHTKPARGRPRPLLARSETHLWLARYGGVKSQARLGRLARKAEWLDRYDKSGFHRWLAWATYWAAAGNRILATLYSYTAAERRKTYTPV